MRLPRLLRILAPYLLTGLAAVAVSLLLMPVLIGPPQSGIPAPPTMQPSATIAAPTAAPTPQSSTQAQPTRPLPAERVLEQELLDLRALGERQASFVYLLKAEAQLRLAEEALLLNNMVEVDRTLLDVDVTYTQAYERSADAARSPILQLREQLSLIHDDLYVRPEGIDSRLKRLRQSTLILVDEIP